MMTPPADSRATARPAGLIDTLWTGFDLIRRHAWLLILPTAVDALLWIGPQLTAGPVLERWAASAVAPLAGDPGIERAVDEARGSAVELMREGEALRRFNLLSLLAVPVIGLPSFRAGAPGQGPVLELQSEGGVAAIGLGSLFAGLVLGALFYGLLGHVVREGALSPRQYLTDVPRALGALFALFGLLALIGLAVGVSIGALRSAPHLDSPAVAGIIGPIIVAVLIWGFVYCFFTVDAIFVSRLWPIAAIKNSILVVRSHFWQTLGFIGMVFVISEGFPFVWEQVAMNLRAPGVILAILGHNYISSGIAAASMTYYKERIEQRGAM